MQHVHMHADTASADLDTMRYADMFVDVMLSNSAAIVLLV